MKISLKLPEHKFRNMNILYNIYSYISDTTYEFAVTRALYAACRMNDIEFVKKYISSTKNINYGGPGGESMLYCAVQHNNHALISLLLENGADVNQCDDKQKTPLALAIQSENIDIIRLLLEHGADPKKATLCGLSVLPHLIRHDMHDIFMLLLKYSEYFEDEYTSEAIMLVICIYKKHQYLEALLTRVIDVNNPSLMRKLLLIAAKNNAIESVKMLLDYGADGYYNYVDYLSVSPSIAQLIKDYKPDIVHS